MAIGVALQRRFEPGQRGDQAILGAHQFAAQQQRIGIAAIERDGLFRRLDRADDIARVEPEPAHFHPGIGAVRRGADQRRRRLARRRQIAARGIGAAAQAQDIEPVGGQRLARFDQRAARVALQQNGLGHHRGGAFGFDAGIDRAAQRGFGGDPFVQHQQRAGERQMRLAPLRVGAHRGERLTARGRRIAGPQIGFAARHRLARQRGIGAVGHDRTERRHGDAERADAQGKDDQAAQRDAARGAAAAFTAGGHRPSSDHKGWGG